MNRKLVIETIKRELARVHSNCKVIHSISERDNIDIFTLVKDNVYLAVPVFGMNEIINLYDNPIPVIMLDIMYRLMNFMENISK